MLALTAHSPSIFNLPSKPKLQTANFHTVLTFRNSPAPNPKQFRAYPQNGDKNNDLKPENGDNSGGNGEDDGKAKNGKFRLNLLNLVLDPDPDNVVAVGLTGVLTWASVQVLWQLIVVAAAILTAAVKYTVVAALLIFILITLL